MSPMDAATTVNDSTVKINKFGGDNFHLWKFKMMMWEDQGDAAEQARYTKWQKKAFAIVCLSLEASPLSMGRSCKTAEEAWKRLGDHYEKQILANKLYLRKKFFSCAMVEGSDMLKHINEMKTLSEQLEAVGAPVSEEDLVTTLLSSLPESYEVLITVLESRSDALSWEFVTSRLFHEEMKRKEQGSEATKCAAFLAKQDLRRVWPLGEQVSKAHRNRRNLQIEDEVKEETMWFIDSGATNHMTNSKANMINYKAMKTTKVHLADNDMIEAIGRGDIVMELATPEGPKRGVLKDVWQSVSFEKNTCVMEKSGTKFAIGERFGKGFYKLKMKPVKAPNAMANLSEVKPNPSKLWHERLGHIGSQDLQVLVKNKLSSDMPLKSVEDWGFCDSCALGKQARFKFNKKSANQSTAALFEEISMDICGPMQTPSIGGSVYFGTFICNNSTYCWVYLLRKKSEIFDKFVESHAMVKTQFKANIKRLRSDNGREYQNRNFEDYCKTHGILQHFSPAYTPELNGLAERMNRTQVESARCMLEHAGLPREYWAEAITIAAHIRNRMPTHAIQDMKSPFEVVTGSKPKIEHFKVFGCEAFARVPKEKRKKFDAKTVRCRFLGYDLFNNGYRLEDLSTGRILISCDVKFNESNFPSCDDEDGKPNSMQSFSLGGHDVRFEQPEDNTDSQEFEDASMDGGNADTVGEEENQEDFDDVSMHGNDEGNNSISRRDHETPTPRPAPAKRADRSTSLEDMTKHRDNKIYHQIVEERVASVRQIFDPPIKCLSLPIYEDTPRRTCSEDRFEHAPQAAQVKAKKDTPLKTSFRRLNPDSTTDKVLRDLIDSIKRSQRIAHCLGGRIANEFLDPELQYIVEETDDILLTIKHTLESAANFAEEKFENKLHELLHRKLLPFHPITFIELEPWNLNILSTCSKESRSLSGTPDSFPTSYKKVDAVVEGTMPDTDPEYTNKNRLAKALILAALDDHHVRMVKKCQHASSMINTPRPIWQQTRMEPSESARVYCDRFKMTLEDALDANVKIDHGFAVHQFLRSLDHRFDSFVHFQFHRLQNGDDVDETTLPKIYTALLQEDTHVPYDTLAPAEPFNAAFAMTPRRPRGNQAHPVILSSAHTATSGTTLRMSAAAKSQINASSSNNNRVTNLLFSTPCPPLDGTF
ncbi:hypothetical protein LEN26_017690 [Aphanomyces euteiches]|nr:hypothetical protein LEN26_017690 [Aphanomyces euteiches]